MAHGILRVGARGQVELEAVGVTPLLVDGEPMRVGERRRLVEADIMVGEMELRVGLDGLVPGGATGSSSEGGAVDDVIQCSMCISTVLPTVLRTPCSLALCAWQTDACCPPEASQACYYHPDRDLTTAAAAGATVQVFVADVS